MSVTIHSSQVVGLGARMIGVEVDISPGLHVFTIVGLADKEVQESRERISSAIRNIGALAPHKKSQRVIVNLAPADIKKEGPAFDLPIALGYLFASGQVRFDPKGTAFLGELGLDGSLRSVSGILPAAIAAKEGGFSRMVLPKGNGREAAVVEGVSIMEAEHLSEVIEHLSGRHSLPIVPHRSFDEERASPAWAIDFRDIKGQEAAKRALVVAASGGHNVMLFGPPGSGKTILARALSSLLPRLTFEEAMEVSKIYSIAGMLDRQAPFMVYPPFRNPHHTSSHTSIVGGGTYPKPGEVTLAHRGVLFLDEFAEFDRRVIEVLRQPLEEYQVTVTRMQGTQTFPAAFMLIAAMNPCPCGNFGNPGPGRDCSCSPGAVTKYKKKISGPILDRIDIHMEVPQISHDELTAAADATPSEVLRKNVEAARAVQRERYRDRGFLLNAHMRLQDIKTFIPLTDELRGIVRMAHDRYHLSARAYHRLLKVARTIADLEGAGDISSQHLSEALRYRVQQE